MAKKHCFSVYYPSDNMWELELAQVLADKHGTSVGSIMRSLLKIALKENGLMDKDGNSTVKGIGPEKKPAKVTKKKELLKPSTSLTAELAEAFKKD